MICVLQAKPVLRPFGRENLKKNALSPQRARRQVWKTEHTHTRFLVLTEDADEPLSSVIKITERKTRVLPSCIGFRAK